MTTAAETPTAEPAAPAAPVIVTVSDATKKLLWDALEKGRHPNYPERAHMAEHNLTRLCGTPDGSGGFTPPKGFTTPELATHDIRHVLGSLAKISVGFDKQLKRSYIQKYYRHNTALSAGLRGNKVSSETATNAILEIEYACFAASIPLTAKPLVIYLEPATNDLLHRAAKMAGQPHSHNTALMREDIDQLCGRWNSAGHYDPPSGFTATPGEPIKHVLASLAHELGKGDSSDSARLYREKYPLYSNSLRHGLIAIGATHDEMLAAIHDIEQKCAAAGVNVSRRTFELAGCS